MLALFFFAAMTVLPLSGQQQNNGSFKGTVKDPQGAAIQDAKVIAVERSTGMSSTTKTNGTGDYVLLNLAIGQYTLTVSNTGFKTDTIQNIRLVAGETLTFDVNLAVGSISQSVTVSASAEQIDTTNSDMGTTLSTEELTALPLPMAGNPRAALSFLNTISGVNNPNSQGAQTAESINTNFTKGSIQGSSTLGSNPGYTIDGMNAAYTQFSTIQDFTSILPEAVQEVRLASNFNADQGWNSGVGIAMVTKSGSNRFHGSLFEYLQNTAFDSKNYFSKAAASDNQNEFGFTLGGPIRRDKTFFFASLDFFRYHHTPTGVVKTVPTAQMKNGDFTQLLGAQVGTDKLGRPVYAGEIYDPTTTSTLPDGTVIRDPYDCNGQLNVMCPSSFSSVSSAFAAGYPTPTLAGIQNNWVGANAPSPLSVTKFSVKIDQQIGEKYKLTAGIDAAPSYNKTSGSANFGPLLTTTQFGPAFEYRPRVALTGTLRPNLLFNVNFSAAYVGSQLEMNGEPAATAGQKAGLTGTYTPNLPVVSITNMSGFGTEYLGYSNPQYTLPAIGGFFAWEKGAHSLKWGADFRRSSIADINLDDFTAGQYNFSNLTTGLPGFASTGSGFASFLTGDVNSGLLKSPETLQHYGEGWDLYGQDQWRITPKFTVNYGLRWSASLGPWEANDSYGAFDPNIPNPAAGGLPGALTFWGSGTGRNGRHYLTKPDFKIFEPRLGFAYSPTENTVVRAYYGLIAFPSFAAFNEGTTAPFYGATAQITNSTEDNGVTPAFNWDNGYPAKPVVPNRDPSFLNGSAVQEVDYNNNETGRTQAFGLSVEHGLPWGLTAKGEYIGKLSHGLLLGTAVFNGFGVGGFPGNQLPLKYLSLGNLLLANINSPQAVAAGILPPYSGFNGSVAQALLPFPQYAYVGEGTNASGFSEYNSGHFSLQKRYGSGLSFLVDYTVSKQLGTGYYQDDQASTQKALQPADIPWNLAISYAYDLPFGKARPFLNGNGLVDRLLGDWNVAGIQNYSAGSIINVTTNASVPGITFLEATRMPGVPIQTDVNCSGYVPGKSDPYLNINAFATPAPFTLGNIYTLPNVRGCGYVSENLSVSKGFQMTESSRIKISANFFNAFNRHIWTNLGANINNQAAFGTFSGASAPRSIQLAARIEF